MALLLGDHARFAKAEALQAALKSKPPLSPPKLQIVCLDFFISKLNVIVWWWNQSGENIFDQLPNFLKTSLLNELLSTAHLKIGEEAYLQRHFYEFTYMLMNETTVKLDYQEYRPDTMCISDRTPLEELREILVNAALKCPKLELLAAHEDNKFSMPFFTWAIDAMSPRSGIHHLLKLEGLRHLDIFGLWYWTDEGLNKLFSRLKKLITLKICLHPNVSVSGFENAHLLKELEEFHFVIDNPGRSIKGGCHYKLTYAWIYNFLAQNVRSLKLIGAPATEFLDENSHCHYKDSDELKEITPRFKGTSKLEHLHTNSSLPTADLPNLQHLYFFGPIARSSNKVEFFKKFATFTRLTTLIIGRLPSDEIAQILQSVGKQLTTLYIYEGESADLFQILHFCPNLAKFHQHECYLRRFDDDDEVVQPGVQTSKYEALVTQHNVRLLEHFKANFDGRYGGKDKLFELLVFAPLMNDLWLMEICISRAQCQLFYDMEEGKLSKLESFFLTGLDLDPPCTMDDVGLVAQCIVCSAPRLDSIDFWWNDADLSDDWELSSDLTQSFLELVQNK